MQVPSICRVVLFMPPVRKDLPYKSEPCPAIITSVNPDESVSLYVITRTDAYHVGAANFSEKPQEGFWSWPPKV